MILGMNLIAFLSLLCFIGLGVWDLIRIYKGIPTITHIVRQKLSNKVLSVGLFCVLVVVIWWLLGANAGVTSIGVGIAGHLTLWE